MPVYAKHVQIMLEQWHRLGEQEIDLQPLIHNLTLVWRTIITTTTTSSSSSSGTFVRDF